MLRNRAKFNQNIFKKQTKNAGGARGGSPLPERRSRPPRVPEARGGSPFQAATYPSSPVSRNDGMALSMVIFGMILAITYTSRIKVILGPLNLL